MVVAEEVAAKNFVLNIGHLRGERSQWCNRLTTHKKVVVAGFAFVEAKRKGKDKVEEEGLIVGGAM